MNLTIAAMTARAMLGRRRVLLLLPMPVLLVGLALLGHTSSVPANEWGPVVIGNLGLGVILPLTALIVGSSVLGMEIEDGTITHVLATPLPRSEIVLAKLVVAVGVTIAAAVVPLAVVGAVAESRGLAIGLFAGGTVAALTYSSVFLALSVVTRRPVAVGLVYIMLWESLLTNFVDGARVFSIAQYAVALTDGLADSAVLDGQLSTVTAAIMAAVFLVLATTAATNRLRSFSFAGETG
jgi:ABC-2 type transport system permease protein